MRAAISFKLVLCYVVLAYVYIAWVMSDQPCWCNPPNAYARGLYSWQHTLDEWAQIEQAHQQPHWEWTYGPVPQPISTMPWLAERWMWIKVQRSASDRRECYDPNPNDCTR